VTIKVKICGVKSINHAKACIEGKAAMIGLMFYQKSPRFISLEKAKKISNYAKKKIKRVGIVANMSIEEIKNIIKRVDLDYLQFHGNESAKFLINVRKLYKVKIIKALKIKNKNDIKKVHNYKKISDYILLDTKIVNNSSFDFKKKSKKLNWDMLNKIKDKHKLILSGAININNLKEAINNSKIKFVDVSSSLELKTGNKSIKKINNFLKLAIKL
tara:strand:- start:93 stop:737 length:645 start_codon:yes stop_codon:yes gene_type:complete